MEPITVTFQIVRGDEVQAVVRDESSGAYAIVSERGTTAWSVGTEISLALRTVAGAMSEWFVTDRAEFESGNAHKLEAAIRGSARARSLTGKHR